MTDRAGDITIDTVAGTIQLLRRGDCLVMRCPNQTVADLASASMVSWLDRSGGCLLVTMRGPTGDDARSPSCRVLSLEDVHSSTDALRLLTREVRKIPARARIAVPLQQALPTWLSRPTSLLSFTEGLLQHSKKWQRSVVLVLPFDPRYRDALVTLKDSADFYFDMVEVGSLVFGQFLSARQIDRPAFFFPRRLTLSGDELRLGAPLIPSYSATQDGTLIGDAVEGAYRVVFDALPEAIVLFDPESGYREANRKATEVLGYSENEVKQLQLKDIVAAAHRIRAYRALHTLRKRKFVSAELNIKRKSGRTVTVGVTCSRLSDGRFAAVLRDVTAERKVEAETGIEEERLRSMVQGSSYPQVLVMNRRLTSGNAAFRRAFPWVPEEGSTLAAFFGKKNSEFIHDLAAAAWPADGLPGSYSREVVLTGSDETTRTYEISVSPLLTGKTRAFHLTFVDVSDRIRLVESLEESEKRFRVLIDNSIGAVSVVQDGLFTFVNRAFLELFGYLSSEHVVGQSIAVVGAPRERKALPEKFQVGAPGSHAIRRIELAGITNDGRHLALEVSMEQVVIGGAHSLLCYWRDCTAQKSGEQELRRRTRELDVSEKMLSALHSSIEPHEVMQAGLHSALRWLEFDCGGVFVRQGPDFVLALDHELPELVATTLSRQSATEGFFGYVSKTHEPLNVVIPDYPPHLPFRSLFESQGFLTVTQLPVVKDEELQAILLLCSKKILGTEDHDPILAEVVGRHFGHALFNATVFDRVRASEERYHKSVDALEDVVYQALPNGAMAYVSPQVERLLGHGPDDFLRSADLWRTLCHPDDRAKYSERISASAQGKDSHIMEYRILPKGKAAYRWVREIVRYRRSESGALTEIRGVVSDITQQVDLQEALAASAVTSNTLMENSQDGLVVYDSSMKCVAWNAALEAMTGMAQVRAVGGIADDGIPGVDREAFAALVRRAAGGETVSDELTQRLPGSGGEKILLARFAPVRSSSGTGSGVVGCLSDRTQIKTLEREAKESEDTLRNLIDAMGDALLISDLQGRIWDVNKEFLTLTEYSRSEVVGASFPYPWLLDEEMSKFVVWIAALREKKFLRDFDMTWQRRDGHNLAISLNTTLLRNAAGEPVAMLNIARDISERKRLTNELASKNRQIEMLNRIISKANSTVEFENIFESIASEVQALLPFDQISVGLLSDDRQSMRIHACISTSAAPLPIGSIVPLYRTVWRIAVEQGEAQIFSSLTSHPEFAQDTISTSQGLRSEISIPITLKERVLGTFNIGSTAEHAFTGTELTYLQPIADQIGALIDRTQLFQRVSDDSKYIHNLLNSIESVVYTVDPGFHIREVNKAWESFAEVQGLEHLRDETDVIGRRIDDVIVEPSLWEELKSVMPQLFARDLEVFSRDLEVSHRDGARHMFHLVVSPMVINDRVTGLVFTFTDITEIKRREAEIRIRNRELLALNAISTSISQSLNLDAVLDVAAEGTLEIVGAKAVLCYLWDQDAQEATILRHPGMPEALVAAMGTDRDSANLARTVITGRVPLFISRALLVDDRIQEKERAAFDELGVRSIACLPLISKHLVRGALLVAFPGEHEFTEQEERFLELIGNNIASAIENAQLYTEVQDQVRVVTSLYELGKRLTGALDRRTVLDVLSQEVRKSIPFTLFAYDTVRDDQAMERVFQTGEQSIGDDQETSTLPEPIRQTVLFEHKAAVGTDQRGQRLLAVPVRSENRTTGVLSIIAGKAVSDGGPQLRLLESIANLAGIALDRAVLYDDTLAKSIEIEQRNRELDDFTYVVSHDLKEPLITIEGYSKIVLKDYEDHLDQQGKEFLSAVVHSTGRMKSLIDDLLTLSRVGRAAESQEPVQVNALLEDLLREFEFTLREKNAVVVVPPGLPTVQYNPTQLGMVFRNLIGNAIKFNDNPEPRVEIGLTEGENDYTFLVADNGIGIEPQHFEKIFVIFQRLHRTDQYQGTGAGLTIVKKIVENHRGRIWLESAVGTGTTFFFTIPK